MSSQDLEDLFTQAASIAGKVPKNLQEAAFNRALDHLMKGGVSAKAGDSAATRAPAGAASASRNSTGLPAMDRTRLPDIGATSRLADRALKVLQLALHEYNHDGLTAGEISDILTNTFRLPAKVNAVAMALARETTTVNLRRDGSRNVFHIMQPGEDYLASLRAKGSAAPSKRVAATRPRKAGAQRIPKPGKSDGESASVGKLPRERSRSAAGVSGRPGPKAAIERLIGRGYFGSPRTISDVRAELKHALGFDFAIQELSISLVRLLRGGQLSRDRNVNEQYEYRT